MPTGLLRKYAAHCNDTNYNEKRAELARSWALRRCYAASVCVHRASTPTLNRRIALIERSIAAHRRPISAAARPSA